MELDFGLRDLEIKSKSTSPDKTGERKSNEQQETYLRRRMTLNNSSFTIYHRISFNVPPSRWKTGKNNYLLNDRYEFAK
jgi:hypothetical protein